jgi:hypothetical protein
MRKLAEAPSEFLYPFGTSEQVENVRKQLAHIAAKTGIPYSELLDMPTDLREDLMISVSKVDEVAVERIGETLKSLFTGLTKMFTNKRKK